MPAPALFLAFGKVSSPHMALAREGAALGRGGPALGRQVALIGPGEPAFRLNSPGWLSVSPALIAALTDRAGLRMLCRDRLRGMTPPFAAAAGRWIDLYLDLAEDAAGPPGDGAAVTQDGDRVFSSLLPLPAARILPVDVTEVGIHPRPGIEFVQADLALWDGAVLTALIFGRTDSLTPRRRAALDRLRDACGPALAVMHIDGPATARQMAERLSAAAANAPQPWFGPFRAPEFFAALP